MSTFNTLDHAAIIDQNFQQRVIEQHLPQPKSSTNLEQANLNPQLACEIFTSQIESRVLDLIARQLRKENKGFYTIGSSGHEGNAAIAAAFKVYDMAFLHYRSGAFMLQRARQFFGESRLYDQLLALVASKLDPIAGGRHKVFGSLQLNVPPQTSTVASHLPKAVGTAFSISKAKDLKIQPAIEEHAVILCSFGDASFNHSTAQGAFNAAQWINDHHLPLPLVFICEDNGIGVSVPTLDTWIADNVKHRIDMEYLSCDGANICDIYLQATQAASIARTKKVPVFLHMKTVRLLGHAGSDIEQHYHTQEEIEALEAKDPLLYSAGIMLRFGLMTSQQILELYAQTKQTVTELASKAAQEPKLSSVAEIIASIVPPKRKQPFIANSVFELKDDELKRLNLAQAINASLEHTLKKY